MASSPSYSDFNLTSAQIAGVKEGLQQLFAFFDSLNNYAQIASNLPIVGSSIGQVLDIGGRIKSTVVQPASNYLDLTGASSTASGLASSIGGTNVSSSSQLRIQFSFSQSSTLATFPINLGTEASALGISVATSTNVSLGANLQMNGTFVYDLNVATPQDAFSVEISSLKVTASVSASNLSFSLNLGNPFNSSSLNVNGGNITLNGGVDISLIDPTNDGRITERDLKGYTLNQLATLNPVGTLSLDLPLSGNISGNNFSLTGSAHLLIDTTNIFNGPNVDVNLKVSGNLNILNQTLEGTFVFQRLASGAVKQTIVSASITKMQLVADTTKVMDLTGSLNLLVTPGWCCGSGSDDSC